MIQDARNLFNRQRFPLALPYSVRHPRFEAQPTGEFRPPRKNEWYISGAIPEVYQAPNDLSTAFHIARLVAKY